MHQCWRPRPLGTYNKKNNLQVLHRLIVTCWFSLMFCMYTIFTELKHKNCTNIKCKKSQSGSVPIQEQHDSSLHSTCKNYIYFTLNNNICIITWVRMLIVWRMFEFVCVKTCCWCWPVVKHFGLNIPGPPLPDSVVELETSWPVQQKK